MPKKAKTYFKYNSDTSQFFTLRGRPSNQRDASVKKKIYQRLRKLEQDPDIKLLGAQKKFMREYASNPKFNMVKSRLDIAHQISIDALKKSLCTHLNKISSNVDEHMETFLNEILSSDDEDGVKNAKSQYSKLRDQTLKPKVRIENASKLVTRLNKAHKNLLPGHVKVNRGIQSLLDPHLVADEKDKTKPLPKSIEIRKAFEQIHEDYYDAKHKVENNEIKVLTSSKDAKQKYAWTSDKSGIFAREASDKLAVQKVLKGHKSLKRVETKLKKGESVDHADPNLKAITENLEDLDELDNKDHVNELREMSADTMNELDMIERYGKEAAEQIKKYVN